MTQVGVPPAGVEGSLRAVGVSHAREHIVQERHRMPGASGLLQYAMDMRFVDLDLHDIFFIWKIHVS